MGAAVLGLSNLVNRIGRCSLFESKVIIFLEVRVRLAYTLRWVAILGKRGVAKLRRDLEIKEPRSTFCRTGYYIGVAMPQSGLDFMDNIIDKEYSISVISRIELYAYSKLSEKDKETIDIFTGQASVLNINDDTIEQTI